jgi:Family of unknown function (DUF6228)
MPGIWATRLVNTTMKSVAAGLVIRLCSRHVVGSDDVVKHGGAGDSIRLTGPSGATVIIGNGVDPYSDGYDFVDFSVSIAAEGLSATTQVRSIEGDSPLGLHRFLRELADDWKGAKPVRRWEAIEHGLTIDVHRDPLGHVVMAFSLRENYQPDAWLARATVQLDAGEELALLAREVERLLTT